MLVVKVDFVSVKSRDRIEICYFARKIKKENATQISLLSFGRAAHLLNDSK
jgi:hypothetical protein